MNTAPGAICVFDRIAPGVAHDIEADDFIQYIASNRPDTHRPVHAVIVRAFGGPA